MSWPKTRFNPLQFFLGFLADQVVFYWFHEFFHWITVTLFGGTAAVRGVFGALPVFVTDIPTDWLVAIPLWQQAVITIAGGWGVAAYCWFKWAQTTDLENRIIYHALGWAQFGEGAFESVTWILGVYNASWAMTARFASILLLTLFALARSKKMWEAPHSG